MISGAPMIWRFLWRPQLISDSLCEFFFQMFERDLLLLRQLIASLPAAVTSGIIGSCAGIAAFTTGLVPGAGSWYGGYEDKRADEEVKAAFNAIVNVRLQEIIQGASPGPPFQLSNVQSVSRQLDRFRRRTPSIEGMGHEIHLRRNADVRSIATLI
jgi:hypothetical protein